MLPPGNRNNRAIAICYQSLFWISLYFLVSAAETPPTVLSGFSATVLLERRMWLINTHYGRDKERHCFAH